MNELFTIQEAAKFLHLHTSSVYRAVERGWLRHYKIGAALRFDEPQLREFLASREVQPLDQGHVLKLVAA